MRTLHFPAELIQGYYTNDFGIDLRRYFDIKPMMNHRDITFIRNLNGLHNQERKCSGSPACRYSLADYRSMRWLDFQDVENETEKNFIFAGIFYFLVLAPQTLREMFGQEVEYNFYRCTGWPLISAGLGGYLPPVKMLKEASLFPCSVERKNFHRMLTKVGPFMNYELRGFFKQEDRKNLNNEAYIRMLVGMEGRIEDFLLRINDQSVKFCNSLKVDSE